MPLRESEYIWKLPLPMSAKKVDVSIDWIFMSMPTCLSICWTACARVFASASVVVLKVKLNPFG